MGGLPALCARGGCAICIARELCVGISVCFLLCSQSLKGKHVLLSNIKIINIVRLSHISVCSLISKCCYFSTACCNKLKCNLNLYFQGSQFRRGFQFYFHHSSVHTLLKCIIIPIRQMHLELLQFYSTHQHLLVSFLIKNGYALKSGHI